MPARGRRSMLSLPASRYGKAIAWRPARSLAPLARPAWPLRLFFTSRSATTASPSIRWFFRAGWKQARSRASTKSSAHGLTVTPKSLTTHPHRPSPLQKLVTSCCNLCVLNDDVIAKVTDSAYELGHGLRLPCDMRIPLTLILGLQYQLIW